MKYKYPPETILSHSFFAAHTAEFFDFYRNKILYAGARPTRRI
jgi:NAD-dependent deacetylase